MSDTLLASYDQTVNSEDQSIEIVHPASGGAPSSYGSYDVTVLASAKVTSCKFWIKKSGSPSALFIVKIYDQTAHAPNNVLATSDTYQVSGLTTSLQLIEFTFSGANQITLVPGTNYNVQLQAPASAVTLDSTNKIYFGRKSDSTGDGLSYYVSAGWQEGTTHRPIYYLYGIPTPSGGAFLLNFI